MSFNIKIPYVIASHVKKFTSTASILNKSKAAGLGLVSGILYFHNGTAVVPVGSSLPFNTYAVDGAISAASQMAYLTKPAVAGAYTLAAPGAAGIGAYLTITTGSDFAHVVTFTGSTLRNGTAGAKLTWTAAAFAGSSITVVGVTAALWNVESVNLGVVA